MVTEGELKDRFVKDLMQIMKGRVEKFADEVFQLYIEKADIDLVPIKTVNKIINDEKGKAFQKGYLQGKQEKILEMKDLNFND